MLADLRRCWLQLWQDAGLQGDAEAVFADLCRRYQEPQRAYHNLEHIAECLALLGQLRQYAGHPAAIGLAIWFHDAVYQPQRSDNEAQSAALACRQLAQAYASIELQEHVQQLILATLHGGEPSSDVDTALLLDIDLATLGSEAERYARYEDDIRREYRWVPGFLYRRKRKALLQDFLQRPRLYLTEVCHQRFDAAARRNLTWAIARL